MNIQPTFTQIIDSIVSNDITLSFAAAIGFLFVLSIVSHFGRSTDNGLLSKTAPAILASLGVLGTFSVVYLGLLEFDVQNIDESAPSG